MSKKSYIESNLESEYLQGSEVENSSVELSDLLEKKKEQIIESVFTGAPVVNNLKSEVSSKLTSDRDKLIANIKNNFEKRIVNLRDIVVISNIDFTTGEGKETLDAYSDFTKVVFKRCKFGELKNKDLSKAIFDGCRFTGDIVNCNLTDSIFSEDSKGKSNVEAEKKKPIQIIDCKFSLYPTFFSFEQMKDMFRMVPNGYFESFNDYLIRVEDSNLNYYMPNPAITRPAKNTPKLWQDFANELATKEVSSNGVDLLYLISKDAWVSNDGKYIVRKDTFEQNLRKSHNIPINAVLQDPNIEQLSKTKIYDVTYADIYEYIRNVTKQVKEDQDRFSVLTDDLGEIKEEINYLSTLSTYITVLNSFKEDGDEKGFDRVFKALYENEGYLDSFYGILSDNLKLIVRSVQDKNTTQLKNLLNSNLQYDIDQLIYSKKGQIDEKRKEFNIASFRDFLLSKGKVDDSTIVQIFNKNIGEGIDLEFLDFSNCVLKNVNLKLSKKVEEKHLFMSFENSVIENCAFEGLKWQNREHAAFKELKILGGKRGFFEKGLLPLVGFFFDGAKIISSNFARTLLKSSSFRDCQIRDTTFDDSDISRADFSSSQIAFSPFRNVKVTDSDFSKSFLLFLDFENAQMTNVNFKETLFYRNSLQYASMLRCNFERSYIDRIDATNARFVECTLTETEKLILEGKRAYFELCDVTKNKLLDLGKEFETFDIKYNPKEIKLMPREVQAEFRGSFVREANRKFYVGTLGKCGHYLSDFVPDMVQTKLRLLTPVLSEKKDEFAFLAKVTAGAAFIAGVLSRSFNKKQQIAIQTITCALYLLYLTKYLSKFFNINLKESDSKVVELDKIAGSFEESLHNLKLNLNKDYKKVQDKISKSMEGGAGAFIS